MIAVTGATGLLGNFIVRKLVEQNESVLALKRPGSDDSILADISDKITWFEADILDMVSLHEALEKVSYVIHSAAIVSFNPHKAKAVMDVNVQGDTDVRLVQHDSEPVDLVLVSTSRERLCQGVRIHRLGCQGQLFQRLERLPNEDQPPSSAHG